MCIRTHTHTRGKLFKGNGDICLVAVATVFAVVLFLFVFRCVRNFVEAVPLSTSSSSSSSCRYFCWFFRFLNIHLSLSAHIVVVVTAAGFVVASSAIFKFYLSI